MTFRKEGGNEVNKIKNKWYTKYAQTRTKAQFSKVAHACQKKKKKMYRVNFIWGSTPSSRVNCTAYVY